MSQALCWLNKSHSLEVKISTSVTSYLQCDKCFKSERPECVVCSETAKEEKGDKESRNKVLIPKGLI